MTKRRINLSVCPFGQQKLHTRAGRNAIGTMPYFSPRPCD